ncbi:MAG: hypothetical protein M1819_006957 [Sarea resinae]|nr:MAG: hypothetical protein M1819_006957 [Sarea resinae]
MTVPLRQHHQASPLSRLLVCLFTFLTLLATAPEQVDARQVVLGGSPTGNEAQGQVQDHLRAEAGAGDEAGRHDKLGAVASESDRCSRIGIDLLRRGGNAADAMVGTVLCVGTIGMYHSGIGGGGFMLVRAANGSYESIDFRETAPASAYEDMYAGNTEGSLFGGLASGVPGELRGLEHLHRNYGQLPWATVVMPAVEVARSGFDVTSDLVRYMEFATHDQADFLTQDPAWAIDFAPNGTRVGLGDVMTRKRYADTLETIALEGADAFYEGAMARALIDALQDANGTMTLEDLRDYTVIVRESAMIDYRGYRLRSCPAPASGGVALAVLKTVEGYADFMTSDSAATTNLSTHRLDEAIRFGYGARAQLGDPAFVPGLDAYEHDMMNASTAAGIRAKISDRHTQNVSAYNPSGLESKDTPGTSHVVTADASGLAVSLTTTINLLFGSQLMVPATGLILNNEMNDFSIPHTKNAFGYVPSPYNYIAPRKRPLSSMTPTIVEVETTVDDESAATTRSGGAQLYLALGAAGGSRIITATIQNLVHVLDGNMSVANALRQPRLHDQLVPNEVRFEWGYDNRTVAAMAARRHNVSWMAPGESSAQALRLLPNGTFEAAGEPRQRNSGGFAI